MVQGGVNLHKFRFEFSSRFWAKSSVMVRSVQARCLQLFEAKSCKILPLQIHQSKSTIDLLCHHHFQQFSLRPLGSCWGFNWKLVGNCNFPPKRFKGRASTVPPSGDANTRSFSVSDLSTWCFWAYLGGSKNRGTPKWMVYNGNPY